MHENSHTFNIDLKNSPKKFLAHYSDICQQKGKNAEMPWGVPMVVILPPLRGSNVNIVFSVGYVHVAHCTHG